MYAQPTARNNTLVDVVLPRRGLLADAALVIGFAFFTAVAAQVSLTPPNWYADLFGMVGIPIAGTPVPITGQTLAVLLTGAALGSNRAVLSMLLYMSMGMIGLPVYAGAIASITSGEAAFGATNGAFWSQTPFWSLASGGYIVGFIAAGYIVGRMAERGWDRLVWRTMIAILVGNVIIYLFGLPWLYMVLSKIPSLQMDLGKTLAFGLWPFIPGDIIKLLIVAGFFPGAWELVRRVRGE